MQRFDPHALGEMVMEYVVWSASAVSLDLAVSDIKLAATLLPLFDKACLDLYNERKR